MKTCKVIILTVMFITSGGFAVNEVNAQKTASTITTATLIKKLIDMDQLAQFPSPAYKMIQFSSCLLYTSPSPRDRTRSRMPSSA